MAQAKLAKVEYAKAAKRKGRKNCMRAFCFANGIHESPGTKGLNSLGVLRGYLNALCVK